jgi:5-methylcytosine-specific restriction endonuclease McrA
MGKYCYGNMDSCVSVERERHLWVVFVLTGELNGDVGQLPTKTRGLRDDMKKKKKIENHFQDFDAYLDWVGAEKMPLTNPYEIARFIANEIVCVVYRSKKGSPSYSNDEARKVHEAYFAKQRINVSSTKRKQFDKGLKQKLFQRDGKLCFYTGVELTEETASIEHLIPLCKGGKNNLDNLVLCTEESNQLMGDKPLIEKIKYRDATIK